MYKGKNSQNKVETTAWFLESSMVKKGVPCEEDIYVLTFTFFSSLIDSSVIDSSDKLPSKNEIKRIMKTFTSVII